MSQVVHKYNIPKQKFSKVVLPVGVKLTRVGVQRDPDTNEEKVVVWGLVSQDAGLKSHDESVTAILQTSVKFASIATGGQVPPGYEYLGTVQLEGQGREAVFHVFYDSQAPISKA
jgi:hypothetical protein